jgi:hypothetical protein
MYDSKKRRILAFSAIAVLNAWIVQVQPASAAVKHLNQLRCASGEIAMFDGTDWVCADGNGSGASFLPAKTEKTKKNKRFVDNGDGTISDEETGLMWEKKDPGDGFQDFSNPHDVDNRYSWTTMTDLDVTSRDGTTFTDFLSRLNQEATDSPYTTCFANYCDWRVPTLAELRSILLEQYPCSIRSPCIDPIFGPTAADFYWSSTSFAAVPSGAWGVFFINGFMDSGNKLNHSHVRAVRGGR